MSTSPSKDRSSLCSFTFVDGRQCRSPRSSTHPHLCSFHARKEAQALAAEQAGRDISSHLSIDYVSACNLSSALGRLFSAVAQNQIKPKTGATLAYLGQTLLQTIPLARHEYTNAFGTDSWRDAIRSSVDATPKRNPAPRAPASEPKPKSDPLPKTPAGFHDAVSKQANTPSS
jgi:hypothetical protein